MWISNGMKHLKKIHRKVTGQGREVGIRMDDSILTRGMFQDDVIYDADGVVIVVNTPPCEVIEVSLAPGHENMLQRSATRSETVMHHFLGAIKKNTFITIYNEPNDGRMLEKTARG